MRTGGCSLMHQSLTPEAATIVKQAINLARRRGHAQVTPIHVATVMLASPAGLLRSACLKSHHHPFQCKALELCFNVALNRLPTTSPTPILAPHPHYPSVSNALVAAFKRAQAHQRRGSVENQQQPILALKIETEQLVISILDDPSVSRVMREAGFNSTHVKSNVEQVVSLEGCSQSITTTNTTIPRTNIAENPSPLNYYPKEAVLGKVLLRPSTTQSQPLLTQFEVALWEPFGQATNEDATSVIHSMMNKKRKSCVVVGETLGDCEAVIKRTKDMIQRGDAPVEIKSVQFFNLSLLSIKNLSREEIDMKLGEIRGLVKGRGVVLYMGDLKWVAEYWANYSDQRRQYYYYCPLEHMIMGIRKIVLGEVENGRVWLMGIANFSSYIKCKAGNPSLETLLDLHPLTIPVGSLDLSLNLDSNLEGQNKSNVSGDGCTWPLLENRFSNHSTPTTSTSSSLPPWLQKCKEESRETSPNDQHHDNVHVKELCNKWNSYPLFLDKTNAFLSCSPSSSTSISSDNHHHRHCCYPPPPPPPPPPTDDTKTIWPMLLKEHPFFLSDQKLNIDSSSSEETENPCKFSFKDHHEFNEESLKAMCSALEKKVPWHKDIIPDIAITILKCRAGLITRPKLRSKSKPNEPKEEKIHQKQETWLFFLGVDDEGKIKIAREAAKLVFGSQSSFKCIGLSSFSSTRADSTDEIKSSSKRTRDENGHSYLERFAMAVKENPHRVFYMEDVEQVDLCSQKSIKMAIESGKIVLFNGETVPLEDAIVIFSCESFSSTSRACSPPVKLKVEEDEEGEEEGAGKNGGDDAEDHGCLDLNVEAEDLNASELHSVGDIGILESVDKQVFFRVEVL